MLTSHFTTDSPTLPPALLPFSTGSRACRCPLAFGHLALVVGSPDTEPDPFPPSIASFAPPPRRPSRTARRGTSTSSVHSSVSLASSTIAATAVQAPPPLQAPFAGGSGAFLPSPVLTVPSASGGAASGGGSNSGSSSPLPATAATGNAAATTFLGLDAAMLRAAGSGVAGPASAAQLASVLARRQRLALRTASSCEGGGTGGGASGANVQGDAATVDSVSGSDDADDDGSSVSGPGTGSGTSSRAGGGSVLGEVDFDEEGGSMLTAEGATTGGAAARRGRASTDAVATATGGQGGSDALGAAEMVRVGFGAQQACVLWVHPTPLAHAAATGRFVSIWRGGRRYKRQRRFGHYRGDAARLPSC